MATRKGFTLIELLVVIAIIAILAAILFPIMAQVQATSKLAKCQNNVKQLCAGALMYEGDTGGSIMPGTLPAPNSGGADNDIWQFNHQWIALVDKYVKQLRNDNVKQTYGLRGVFICPMMPSGSTCKVANESYKVGDKLPADLYRCYGYNYGYLGGYPKPGSTTEVEIHQTGEVAKPTKTIRIMETWNFREYNNWTFGRGTIYCYAPSKLSAYSSANFCWPPGWHTGRTTVGWFDGHVSSVKTCPPQLPGNAAPANAYTGVMEKGSGSGVDPYFRLANPKP